MKNLSNLNPLDGNTMKVLKETLYETNIKDLNVKIVRDICDLKLMMRDTEVDKVEYSHHAYLMMLAKVDGIRKMKKNLGK